MTGLASYFWERRAEIAGLTAEHALLVLAATALAAGIGIPAGLALTRRPALARVVLGTASIAQTVPSLALLGLLIPLPVLGGIGKSTAIIALVVYALLPILRNTHAGIRSVDPSVLEAADGLGFSPGERRRLVELPLALPVILAGVRVATVATIGLATVAAAIGAGGLGVLIYRGIATVNDRLILAGAVPAALLAVGADALLGWMERRWSST